MFGHGRARQVILVEGKGKTCSRTTARNILEENLLNGGERQSILAHRRTSADDSCEGRRELGKLLGDW